MSTSLGAEGILVMHEKDILISDDPDSFAHSIVRLIVDRNDAIRMANGLREVVRSRYGIAKLAQEGQLILQYLGS